MQRMRERHVATTFDPDAPETLNQFAAADVPSANMGSGGGTLGAGQKTGFMIR